MARLNECFGLIRVINLRERQDRLREVTRELAALDTGFEPGRVEVYAAERPADQGEFRSLGTKGCFLSHLEVLRDACQRGVESVLVLEDDVTVQPRDRQRLLAAAASLREMTWGFAHLGHIQPLPDDGSVCMIPFTGPLQTLHCYAVHRTALPKLVEYLEGCLMRPGGDPYGGPMDVDGALTMFRGWNPGIVTLVAQPSLAGQRSSRSDITSKWWDKVPAVAGAIGLARGLRRRLRG